MSNNANFIFGIFCKERSKNLNISFCVGDVGGNGVTDPRILGFRTRILSAVGFVGLLLFPQK
jgi:hypothetical protein